MNYKKISLFAWIANVKLFITFAIIERGVILRKHRSIHKLILIVLVFMQQGCGYSYKAFMLPSDIKTVYIENFQNATDQPNLENELRAKLIRAFQNDGNLKIASSADADAVLKGTVVGYSRQALRFLNEREVWEYRLSIAVNFEFSDKLKKGIDIVENNFAGNKDFFLSGSNAMSEEKARQEALEDLSKRVLNRIITAW